MGETTTKSLSMFQGGFGLSDVKYPISTDASNSFSDIAKNKIKNAFDMVNSMFSDNENLNYTMALLTDLYSLRNPLEIKEFLGDNKFIISLVSEAHGELQRFFPLSAIFMEVMQNELVISVGTSLSHKEAKERLYELYKEWWLGVDANLRSMICITVEFQ